VAQPPSGRNEPVRRPRLRLRADRAHGVLRVVRATAWPGFSGGETAAAWIWQHSPVSAAAMG